MSFRSRYEKYGNNEPYTEPKWDGITHARNPHVFVQLLSGPSTNIYVGPDEVHFTVPKRLLYRFSDFAKKCLEGGFAEARENAIWLPDVEPETFQWLCQWLYTGHLNFVHTYGLWEEEWSPQPPLWELLCQMHFLGERLLLDVGFLQDVQTKLGTVMEMAKRDNAPKPWVADMMHLVLSDSAPDQSSGWRLSLRPSLLSNLCCFEICTTTNFLECGQSFGLDGGFAAEIMMYLAKELEWAVELWGAQTQSSIDVAEKGLQDAQESGEHQTLTRRPKGNEGRWLALRYACTYTGCTTIDFGTYGQCFETDGSFAAVVLDFMANELRWVVEKWGQERGPKVDIQQEKDDQRWNEDDYDNIERLYLKNMYS